MTMNSFYFLQAEETARNHSFLEELERYCNKHRLQAYVISRPLGDNKYAYSQKDSFVLLMPKHQIVFIDFFGDTGLFTSYCEDFVEDLGSISDKYRYKEIVGRPRSWSDLIAYKFFPKDQPSVADLVAQTKLTDPKRQRICELLISLLTGSINDVDKVKADAPETLLDKVKQKILLFDGDQTRFIYDRVEESPVRIQGLSGTGKTELLLHKLKDLYTESGDKKIVFTCHNRILADTMRRRIPDFFNFMKVEQQIQWNERLWCMHAWGSGANKDSGTYRYICDFYNIPFLRYSGSVSFDVACKQAIADISKLESPGYAFDFMLVDESQDFPESFFELCDKVTNDTAFIAGDIFQSIFDEEIKTSVTPHFLLSKCYRTDPRTLMLAHSLGMGLFEPKKLRWLEDDEWKACGYLVEKINGGKQYRLSREPLRRFEDVEKEQLPSIGLIKVPYPFYPSAPKQIIDILKHIQKENPSAGPDDIGVILMDMGSATYKLADELEQLVPQEFGYFVNKAYESKRREKGTLFVSNRNNVKGLEFPFVICVAGQIRSTHSYRNSLYMTLTRSFLQTYLVVSADMNQELLPAIEKGLGIINSQGYIEATQPSDAEKEAIKTTIKYIKASESYFDFLNGIFDEIKVPQSFRDTLTDTVKNLVGEDFDRENVKEIIAFNYKKIAQQR